MLPTRYLALLIVLPVITSCSEDGDRFEMPYFEEPGLVQGRNTWMQICRNCHLVGVAGAPAVTNREAWQGRFSKGRERLYQSAINGIRREGKWTMPPRGGEARLSDTQVYRAVDYMLAAALSEPTHAQE